MSLNWDKVKEVREQFAQAHTRFMNGSLTWDEFEPIKKEWAAISAEIGRARRANSKQIEKDLQKKYGQDRYRASL